MNVILEIVASVLVTHKGAKPGVRQEPTGSDPPAKENEVLPKFIVPLAAGESVLVVVDSCYRANGSQRKPRTIDMLSTRGRDGG